MKQDKIDVSVIMPVYNAARFLRDSVSDVLAQTFSEFELICIDDGSNDGSGEILDELAAKDKRIKVIHQENAGGGVARNRGLDVAQGKYLLFFDSDDRFDSHLIEKVYSYALDKEYDLVAFGGDTFDDKTGTKKAASWLIKGDENDAGRDPLKILNTSVWNKMYRKEIIKKHSVRFQDNRIVDTMYFVCMNLIYSEKIGIVKDVLVHYRTNNSESIISNSDRYPLEAYNALISIKKELETEKIYEENKDSFSHFASQYLSDRLHILKTYEGYSELYNALHDGGVDELGLDFNGSHMADIKRKEISRYLYDRHESLKNSGLLRRFNYILGAIENKRIVIYGGGEVGRDFFSQAIQRSSIKVVGWVDRNYEKLGFPIQSPEILDKVEYDAVIIGVSGENIASEIKKGLIERGIRADKILWSEPRKI